MSRNILKSFLSAIHQSNQFSGKSLELRDYSIAFLCLITTIISLKLFDFFITQIDQYSRKNGYVGSSDAIAILDFYIQRTSIQ